MFGFRYGVCIGWGYREYYGLILGVGDVWWYFYCFYVRCKFGLYFSEWWWK